MSIAQYIEEVPEGTYSGSVNVISGTCPVPGFSELSNIEVTQDPSDPTKGQVNLGCCGLATDISIQLTDQMGSFSGIFTIPEFPYGACISTNVEVRIVGQFSANSIEHLPESAFYLTNITENGDPGACSIECPSPSDCPYPEFDDPGYCTVLIEFEGTR